MYRLTEAGYSAYLVGGGVRDLLVGLKPKDFDVATDAKPEQVKALFKRCFIIGRRFRLVHVCFGPDKVEVVTFRGMATNSVRGKHVFAKSKQGMLVRDNIFGSIQEDACRRDLSINAIYYNIVDFSLVDYCGGLSDIQNKVIRIIGEPGERYHEDPVRMLRVIRFSSKLAFTIDEKTAAPLSELGYLLQHIPPSRLYEEILKLFLSGCAQMNFEQLRQHGLLSWLLGQTDASLALENFQYNKFFPVFLKYLDEHFHAGQSISPELLFAGLLWAPLMRLYLQFEEGNAGIAFERAISTVLAQQSKQVAIIRRVSIAARDIWHLQRQLMHPTIHAEHMVQHRLFPIGMEFLTLRVDAGEPCQEVYAWWIKFKEAEVEQRTKMIEELPDQKFIKEGPSRKRKKRRGRRFRRQA